LESTILPKSDNNKYFGDTTSPFMSGYTQEHDLGHDINKVDVAPNKWNSHDTSDNLNTNDLESNYANTDSVDNKWESNEETHIQLAKPHKIHAHKWFNNGKIFYGNEDSFIPEEYWINDNNLLIDLDHDGKITEGDVIIDKNGQFLITANHGSGEFQILEFVDKENSLINKEMSDLETEEGNLNSPHLNDKTEMFLIGEEIASPFMLPAKERSHEEPQKSEDSLDHSSYA